MNRKPLKKLKKSRLKQLAWSYFSKYIRLRTADGLGYAKCVTCGEKFYWKNLQAGHFVDGRNNTVLFDERLVWPQCYSCNVVKRGNKVRYFLFMKSRGYTDEQLAEFDDLKKRTKPTTYSDLEVILNRYKELSDNLEPRI